MDYENAFVRTAKIIIHTLAVGIQVILIVSVLLRVSQITTNIFWITWFVGVLTALFIVCTHDKSSNKISWIMFILILPSVGVLTYFIFGKKYIPKRIKTKMKEIDADKEYHMVQNDRVLNGVKDNTHRHLMDMLFSLAEAPAYSNTNTEYFKVGEDMFEKMLLDIKNAKKFIFMEYYIVKEGKLLKEITDALVAKSQEGLEVIMIYDVMGSFNTLPKHFKNTLEKSGIKLYPFNDFHISVYDFVSFRDHRKITVVDGNVGYCGGNNLGDEYINHVERFGHWKDMGIRLEGDACWSLTLTFLKMLDFVGGEYLKKSKYRPDFNVKFSSGIVIPYADGPTNNENPAENLYMKIIATATNYLYITTPYLILDSNFTAIISLAAKSGVDVRILVPHIPDKKTVFRVTRSNYSELLENGVKIYEYTPGFVHGKVFVADDKYAVVGSINLDSRSLTWNYENAVFLYETSSVGSIKEDFLETINISEEITSEGRRSFSLFGQLRDSVLRLLAPLM